MGLSSVFLCRAMTPLNFFSIFSLHAGMIDHIDVSNASGIRTNQRESPIGTHVLPEKKK